MWYQEIICPLRVKEIGLHVGDKQVHHFGAESLIYKINVLDLATNYKNM